MQPHHLVNEVTVAQGCDLTPDCELEQGSCLWCIVLSSLNTSSLQMNMSAIRNIGDMDVHMFIILLGKQGRGTPTSSCTISADIGSLCTIKGKWHLPWARDLFWGDDLTDHVSSNNFLFLGHDRTYLVAVQTPLCRKIKYKMSNEPMVWGGMIWE